VEAGTEQRLVVEREVHIEASPETVFEFFTDPAKMARWMGSDITLDPRPGGVFRVGMSPDVIARGEYVEVESPNRIVHTFGWESDMMSTRPGTTTVEVTFTPVDGGTLVRLVHRDLPTTESAEAHGHGWDDYLARLVIAAAGGDPGPDPRHPKEN
jgi:uncharacterized protein YndB with AHSA1/START domain